MNIEQIKEYIDITVKRRKISDWTYHEDVIPISFRVVKLPAPEPTITTFRISD